MGRVPRGLCRGAVHDRLLLLRSRPAAEPVHPAARGRSGTATGHGRDAWLQPLSGQLRTLPRADRQGSRRGELHRSTAQRPDEAVRPPQRRVPEERPDGRWPLRVRQTRQHHAGLGRHERRSAQLSRDRGPDRLHPVGCYAGVHRSGSVAQRTGHRDRRQDQVVQGLAGPEVQAGPVGQRGAGLLEREHIGDPGPDREPAH